VHFYTRPGLYFVECLLVRVSSLVRVRIRFSVLLVSGYADVFVLL